MIEIRPANKPLKLMLKVAIPLWLAMYCITPAGAATLLLGAPIADPFGSIGKPPKPIPPQFTYTPPIGCDLAVPDPAKCGDAWGPKPTGDGGYRADYIWLKNEAKPDHKKTFVLDIIFKNGIVIGLPLVNKMVDPMYLPNIYWDTGNGARSKNWKSAALFMLPDGTGRQGLQLIIERYPQPAFEKVDLGTWKLKLSVNNVFEDRPFKGAWLDSITASSHCPEPATWAMMIIGFGMVGGVSRSQRRKIGALDSNAV